MPNYFYTDASGQKQGPINDQQLKSLAAQGTITPTTTLETDAGHRGTAGQIPGLFAAEPSPFAPASPVSQAQSHAMTQLVISRPSIFYGCAVGYDVWVNGQNVGKLANGKEIECSVPAGFAKIEVKTFGKQLAVPVTVNCAAGQKKTVVLRYKKNYQLTVILLVLLALIPGIIYSLVVPPYVIEEQV